MWKENIGSLRSTRFNEVWNRIKDKVNKVGPTGNLLPSKNKISNSKEASIKSKLKAEQKLTWIFNICWIWGGVRERDVMKISEFQQVEVDNRETGTNRNDESPTFDERRENRKMRENMRRISKSANILSTNFHVQIFHHVWFSFPVRAFQPPFWEIIIFSLT